jgi:hypothetical protein
MADCYPLLTVCQRLNARLRYGFDWTRDFARRREPGKPHPLGTRIRITELGRRDTGLEYESSGGTSNGLDNAKIAWPTAPGGTVVDGTITWTAHALSAASLTEEITSSTWAAPVGSGIVVDGEVLDNDPGLQRTLAFMDTTGAESGQTYDVVNTVVTLPDTARYEAVVRITVDP